MAYQVYSKATGWTSPAVTEDEAKRIAHRINSGRLSGGEQRHWSKKAVVRRVAA